MNFQDIPDVEGDKVFGIRTFSVRVGQKKVSLEVFCLHSKNEEGAPVTKDPYDGEDLFTHCLASDSKCLSRFLVDMFFRFSGRALDSFRQHMHQLLSLVSHPRLFGAGLLWYEMQASSLL